MGRGIVLQTVGRVASHLSLTLPFLRLRQSIKAKEMEMWRSFQVKASSCLQMLAWKQSRHWKLCITHYTFSVRDTMVPFSFTNVADGFVQPRDPAGTGPLPPL